MRPIISLEKRGILGWGKISSVPELSEIPVKQLQSLRDGLFVLVGGTIVEPQQLEGFRHLPDGLVPMAHVLHIWWTAVLLQSLESPQAGCNQSSQRIARSPDLVNGIIMLVAPAFIRFGLSFHGIMELKVLLLYCGWGCCKMMVLNKD